MKTRFHSWSINGLPIGCKQCVKGRKLVLFVTGICQRNCFYCSISDYKFHKDVTFANERPVNDVKDIIKEVNASGAQGAGFTGGDSLCKIKRTVKYIKTLKEEFGEKFHIHLYTIPEGITKAKLKQLFDAGLDEIRLHPDLDEKKNWPKLKLPNEFNWDYGLEIPAIPRYDIKIFELIEYAKNWITFLNLNELEIADNSFNTINKKGFFTKSDKSYAAKGSQETALKVLKGYKGKLKIHYCTVKLKDKVQLKNRLKNQAKVVKEKYDKVSKDGTLIRGVVYLPGLEPGAKYKERIAKANSTVIYHQLIEICGGARFSTFKLDKKLKRAIVPLKELKKKNVKLLGAIPAIVEEYPTDDSFLIEVEFI